MDVAQVVEAVTNCSDPVAGQLGNVESLLSRVLNIETEMILAKDGGFQKAAIPGYRGVIFDGGQADGVVPDGFAHLGGQLRIGEIQTKVNVLTGRKEETG